MKTCLLQEKRHTIDVDNMPKGSEGEKKWYENMPFIRKISHLKNRQNRRRTSGIILTFLI